MSRKRSFDPWAPLRSQRINPHLPDAAREEAMENFVVESIGEHADFGEEFTELLLERHQAPPEEKQQQPRTNIDIQYTKLPAYAKIPEGVYKKLSSHPYLRYAQFALQDCPIEFRDRDHLRKYLREQAGLEMSLKPSDDIVLRFVSVEIQKGELEEDEKNPLTSTLPAKGEPMRSFHKEPTAEELVMHPELALKENQVNPVHLMMEIQDYETMSSLIEDYASIVLQLNDNKIVSWVVRYG